MEIKSFEMLFIGIVFAGHKDIHSATLKLLL